MMSLSLQIFHPTMSSKEIKKKINLDFEVEYSVNEKRVLPNGKKTDVISSRTYLLHNFFEKVEIEHNEAVRIANKKFRDSISDYEFMKKFIENNGQFIYYMGLSSDEHIAMVINYDVLTECSKLFVSLGIEVF